MKYNILHSKCIAFNVLMEIWKQSISIFLNKMRKDKLFPHIINSIKIIAQIIASKIILLFIAQTNYCL